MTVTVFAVSLLAAMAIGMPIAWSLLFCGLCLMWQIDMFDSQIMAANLLGGADNFPLMAVPFFMLAGVIMTEGGIAKRIIVIALSLLGHKRGGLGYVVILAGCIIGALSGSAAADAAALSSLLMPMMIAAGYDRIKSASLIASSAVVAAVLPPSIGLIIYGVTGGVSIVKLFMAGIVPGAMVALSLAVAWWWVIRNDDLPAQPEMPFKEKMKAVREGIWALMLPFIILFGLRFGIFTPTEAAVVVAVYCLFVAVVIYRELPLNRLYAVFEKAAMTTAIVMFLVAATLVSSWLIIVAEIGDQIVALLAPVIHYPMLLMFALMVLVVVIGTALDMTPTILLLTPMLMPILKEAGIDPVHFGVVFMVNNAIGLITPPVGTVLNVTCGVTGVKMDDIIKGVLPFMFAQLVVLFLLVFVPQIVTVPAAFFSR
ncbi:TRAP transporter large permease subunit [Xanthobacteraceae bacterium Astr-EGSB]|uniref:TRAP transporter large permease subunit n=1 Tax=Astrobacterium formosum TaxID=3069710 RepID=UPI0027B010CE|nr:TRAP transporter large permease subunit [Xanthobacteraceae bacterium Astr-EGSB]